jgi:hypothetical protein
VGSIPASRTTRNFATLCGGVFVFLGKAGATRVWEHYEFAVISDPDQSGSKFEWGNHRENRGNMVDKYPYTH